MRFDSDADFVLCSYPRIFLREPSLRNYYGSYEHKTNEEEE